MEIKTVFWPIILTAVLISGAWYGYQNWLAHAYPLDNGGIYLDEPIPVEEFALGDHLGQTFGRERFRNRWSFLYFGYTSCLDACPMTLAQLDQLEKQLSKQGRHQDSSDCRLHQDPATI